MTVAVSCNLSDGVILGVDSAVTVPAPGGVKIYENAEKLFRIGNRPIGVAVYGLGALRARSIGSYLREFVVRDDGDVVSGPNTLADVVEALREFFMGYYNRLVVPAVEQAQGQRAEDIPNEIWPVIGFVIGGFSSHVYLSEVWHLLIPHHDQPHSAEQPRTQGSFGSHWWSMYEPIRRYALGYDARLMDELVSHFETLRGSPLSASEHVQVDQILAKYAYPAAFDAMPMQEGIEYTRWLVELVVNHHRFSVDQPGVGGEVKLGTVTYTGEQFEILDPRVERGS